MRIQNYVRAASLEEAFKLITTSKFNKIVAGVTWLKGTGMNIKTAVDLMDLDLKYIREDDEHIHIGTLSTLRMLETSEIIERECGSLIQDAVSHLIGIQLRNQITIGAHVYSRFGFSDIIPTLYVLDASVRLFKHGEMKLSEFLTCDIRKDILIEVLIPKKNRSARVKMVRNAYSDYSILCAAASRTGHAWIISVGARPGRAVPAVNAMAYLAGREDVDIDPQAAANLAAGELSFATNQRGSSSYRKELCRNLIRQEIEEIISES